MSGREDAMTQDATSEPDKGRISLQSQSTPAGYPAELQVRARHIKDIQEDPGRSPHWTKVVRVGSHLHIASYYLDAPTFKQWVETELRMYPQIAATYIEISLKKAPMPALEQRELDAIRAKHVSEEGKNHARNSRKRRSARR
jgi:hypothetical protein